MINCFKSFYETLSMNFQDPGSIGALIGGIAVVAFVNIDFPGMAGRLFNK